MKLDSPIAVFGAGGLIGSAIVRTLKQEGYTTILAPRSTELNLLDPVQTKWWFSVFRPEYVFLCAAKVGGIKANLQDPLGFFEKNMAIETNVLSNAAEYGVRKLLFLGSSCIYPENCPNPIKEEYLLTGPFSKPTEPYGLAKVAGVKLCQWYREKGHNFISAMPCNTFGLNDHYDPATAHVVPGLINRMYGAKTFGDLSFSVWGDRTARREFIYADDLAELLLLIMSEYESSEPINAGSGREYTIEEVAKFIRTVVGLEATLFFDDKQPVGIHHKLMDNSKAFALGWRPRTPMLEALCRTYEDFLILKPQASR